MTTDLGYQPPALDLTPFRAGTVWHHDGAAYFVASVNFDESADAARSAPGLLPPAIYQDRPSEVRIELRRASWLDDAEPEWTVDITGRTPLVLAGQAWGMANWSHDKDGSGERWIIRLLHNARRDARRVDE